MRDTINYIVFGWYPYFCLTVFIVGSVLRFDREHRAYGFVVRGGVLVDESAAASETPAAREVLE